MSDLLATQNFRHRGGTSNYDDIDIQYTDKDIKVEILFGRKLASKIVAQYGLYKNNRLDIYINKVGKNLARFSSRPELNYSFAVLDSEDVNAFACPGGYIFVTLGAIKKMKNESQLAGVLAHEISHVTQRHIVKELNIKAKSNKLSFTSLLSNSNMSFTKAMNETFDKAMGLLFNMGLKEQKYEYEADEVATFLVYQVGYKPVSLKNYLTIIGKNRAQLKTLLKTHPPIQSRLNRLQDIYLENNLESVKAPILKTRFEKNVKI
jgi:predicted Zn-dependent protease